MQNASLLMTRLSFDKCHTLFKTISAGNSNFQELICKWGKRYRMIPSFVSHDVEMVIISRIHCYVIIFNILPKRLYICWYNCTLSDGDPTVLGFPPDTR